MILKNDQQKDYTEDRWIGKIKLRAEINKNLLKKKTKDQ